jgi:hypothetical protein
MNHDHGGAGARVARASADDRLIGVWLHLRFVGISEMDVLWMTCITGIEM